MCMCIGLIIQASWIEAKSLAEFCSQIDSLLQSWALTCMVHNVHVHVYTLYLIGLFAQLSVPSFINVPGHLVCQPTSSQG